MSRQLCSRTDAARATRELSSWTLTTYKLPKHELFCKLRRGSLPLMTIQRRAQGSDTAVVRDLRLHVVIQPVISAKA